MKKSNLQKSETAWSAENKTWWNRRSTLERRLLVIIIITIFLIGGFAAFVVIKSKIAVTSNACSTPDCLQAAAQIISHIDPDVDPCEDFFKFACGKFIEHAHGATSIQGLQDQVERQLAEIIKEPTKDDEHYAIRREKELFQACMNESATEEESIDILKKHLKELNGWPVVMGYKWKERLFDWMDIVTKLRKLGYFYEMLIKVNIVEDPVNKGQIILHISEPYVESIKDENKELYKKYMTDVTTIFGAKDRYRTSVEMEKVLNFSEKLRKIIEKEEDIENNETDTNHTAKLLETRFTVEEFEDYYGVYWLDFINSLLYPVANISSSDYVIFPSNDFMNAFLALMSETPKRVQANYIIWCIVEYLVPTLTKELKQLIGNYSCLTEQSSTPPDRFEYCKSILNENYLPEPHKIVYARRYLPPERREKVLELFENIKAEFTELLMQNSWMDNKTKENALEKSEAIVDIIGAPGDYFEDAVFEKYQTINYTQAVSFHSMILNRAVEENNFIFSHILKPMNQSMEITYYRLITKVNAMYFPPENSIILPVAILQGIFYNPGRPLYLNYGAIGSLIGHELAHAFCKDASKYDKDGNERNMWTEDTENAYDEVTQCMIEDAEDFDIEDTEQKINGTQTLEENIGDFAGVKVSYAAYKKWVEENGEEPELLGVDYTPYQLFWISAISHECYKLSRDQLEKGLTSDSHAHNAFWAIAPMRNNADFANDFNCPADSRMNPTEKCEVF